MTAGQPLVSVIIPTYNRAKMVAEAVESVRRQSYPNWEIIVVDDGSTDETPAVFERLGDPRVTYLRLAHGNAAVTRNAGLARARGAFVAPLDSDDLWLPEKLSRQVAHLMARPHVDLVYCQVVEYRVDLQSARFVKPVHGLIRFADLLAEKPYISTSSVLVRKRCLDAIGGYDPRLAYGEDHDLWLRLAKRFTFNFVPEVLVEQRVHGGNLSNHPEQQLTSYEGALAFHEKLARLYWGEMDTAKQAQVTTRIGELRYLIGAEYLRQGRAPDAARLIAGALAQRWNVGLGFADEKASILARLGLLAKPYGALAASWVSILRARKQS